MFRAGELKASIDSDYHDLKEEVKRRDATNTSSSNNSSWRGGGGGGGSGNYSGGGKYGSYGAVELTQVDGKLFENAYILKNMFFI